MSATITLNWHEALWWLQGGMAGSHLRWSVYEDFVNKIWPQLDERERDNIYTIAKRDLSWHFEGEHYDKTAKEHFERLLARYNPSNQYLVHLVNEKIVEAYLFDGKYYVSWQSYCAQDAITKIVQKPYRKCANRCCSSRMACKRFIECNKGDELLDGGLRGCEKCDYFIEL